VNRRSLIPIIIGAAAAIVGMMAVASIRHGRCANASAQWIPGSQTCIAAGVPLDVSRSYDIVLGLVIGLLLAFMMHRASTFAARRRVRKPE
jgi:hypothetical protein